MKTQLTSDHLCRGNLELENDISMNFSSESQTTTSPFAFDPPAVPSPVSSGSTLGGGGSDEEIPLQTLKIL